MLKQLLNNILGKDLEPDNMPKRFDWLIAGLGNPGEKYAMTRHNIGWMVALALAERRKAPFSGGSVYNQTFFKFAGKSVLLIMPTTYMNLSGEAIKKAADKYMIPYSKVIAILDEYNFPVGKVHIKAGGSSGGHNGTESIIEKLGGQNFYRLRCGIGKNFPPGGMVDYVLSNFTEEEKPALEEGINKACEAIEHFIKAGPQRAVSEINSGKLWAPPDEDKPGKMDEGV